MPEPWQRIIIVAADADVEPWQRFTIITTGEQWQVRYEDAGAEPWQRVFGTAAAERWQRFVVVIP